MSLRLSAGLPWLLGAHVGGGAENDTRRGHAVSRDRRSRELECPSCGACRRTRRGRSREPSPCPSALTLMFRGLRSRWTMPARAPQGLGDLGGERQCLGDRQRPAAAARRASRPRPARARDRRCRRSPDRRSPRCRVVERGKDLASRWNARGRSRRPHFLGSTLIATSRRAGCRGRGRPRPSRPRRAARGSRTNRGGPRNRAT